MFNEFSAHFIMSCRVSTEPPRALISWHQAYRYEKDANFFRSKRKRSFRTVKEKKKKKKKKKKVTCGKVKRMSYFTTRLQYSSRKRKRKIFFKNELKKTQNLAVSFNFHFSIIFPGKMNKCSGPVVGSTYLLTRLFFLKKKKVSYYINIEQEI